MLKLQMGTSEIKNTEFIFSALKENSSKKKQVLLVPSQYSADMVSRLCQAGINQSMCEVWTFHSLYDQLCNHFGGGAQEYLDSGSRLLLMYLAVCETEEEMESHLSCTGKYTDLPALLATSEECKRCRVAPSKITEAGDRLAGQEGMEALEGCKLHDVGVILTKYDQLVCQQGAADPADKLNLLEQRMRETGWPGCYRFWITGFSEFTPQELAVIKGLLKNGNDLTVLLNCDDPDKETEDVYTCVRHTAKELSQIAEQAGTSTAIETIENGEISVFSFLKANLYSEQGQQWKEDCPEVAVYAADDLRSEVEHAASFILKRTQGNNGCRYRDFLVTARDIDHYADLIENTFSRMGINCSLDTDNHFLGKPVFTLASAALDAVSGKFRYADLSRYLKTGLTGVDDSQVDLLDNYAVTWDLQGEDWTDLDKTWTLPVNVDRNHKKEDIQQAEAKLNEINVIRNLIMGPFCQFFLDSKKDYAVKKKKGSEFADALYSLLRKIGLQASLEKISNELMQEGREHLAEDYQWQWSVVLCVLERCAQYLDNTEMKLEEFSKIFKMMLDRTSFEGLCPHLDEVTVAAADRLPRQQAKYVIFLGADGNSLPDMKPLPGILTEQERELLKSDGVQLMPDQDDRLSRELALIGDICSIPSDGLLVSWPCRSEQGAESNQPSFLVECMQYLFPKMGLGPMNTEMKSMAEQTENPGATHCEWKPMRSLSSAVVKPLLNKGHGLTISPTGFSDFHSCRFQYFMNHGFEAKPVKKVQFGAREYGDLIHDVLRDVMNYIMTVYPAESDWDKINEIADQSYETYFENHFFASGQSQNRFQWLMHSMKDAVHSVVRNTVEEIYAGEFRPIQTELPFKSYLPGLTEFQISGRIDRVDRYRQYLRVIDYKTGATEFKYAGILNGRLMQLPFYQLALKTCDFKGINAESDKVAGVFYVPAFEPVLEDKVTSKEEGIISADNKRRRSGLLLDDDEVLEFLEKSVEGKHRFLPEKKFRVKGEDKFKISEDFRVSEEQLDLLNEYLISQLKYTADAIVNGSSYGGNMQTDPYWIDDWYKNACVNCEYAQICHFGEGDIDKKKSQYSSVKSGDFWEKITQNGADEEEGRNLGIDS